MFLSVASYGQTVTQTYYDKCTGETKVFTIPIQGSTVVVYYNKTMSVTYNDVQSGAFQAWLEATYQWWSTYNPCSAAQATQNVVQQTTAQATQAASQAAASAATSVPTSGMSTGMSSSSNKMSNSETSTTSESSSSSESSSKEESSSSKSEEKKEEKKEQEKKQAVQPILIAANFMTMQNLDGSFNQVASFGLSQSSLTGETSYNANAMIWSNLKQFSLSLSKSSLLFNYDNKVPVKVGKEILGYKYTKGSLYKITGINATVMLMFNTKVLSIGMNDVFMMKKGLVVGYAFGVTIINIDSNFITSPSATFFATKPFSFKRYVVSPMLALASSPISLAKKITFSQYISYIIGSNFDFNLTKRFKANIGITTMNSTQNIPMTYAITIGSKFKF